MAIASDFVDIGFSPNQPDEVDDTMTKNRMAFEALLEKASDQEFLRALMSFALNQLMGFEVDGLCGAGHGERSPARTA